MNVHTRRFNSHFFYTFRYNRKNFNKLLIIILSISIITYSIISLQNHFIPLALSMAESKAQRIATVVINETVSEKLAGNNIGYYDLYKIEKNNDGQISAVVSNVIKMNQIKSEITSAIQNKISDIDVQQIGIPLGNLSNNYLLAGRGPKIPIKLMIVGIIEMNFKNSFISAGINQTKHEIVLEAKATITAILPAGRKTAEVYTTIPVAETIIVGNVPNTYTNIEGVPYSPQNNILNKTP